LIKEEVIYGWVRRWKSHKRPSQCLAVADEHVTGA
jgi:hypothetical protein